MPNGLFQGYKAPLDTGYRIQDTESHANFAQNQGKVKGTMGKQRRTQGYRKRISKGGKANE